MARNARPEAAAALQGWLKKNGEKKINVKKGLRRMPKKVR